MNVVASFRAQVKALTADLALASKDKARHEEALGNLRQVCVRFAIYRCP